MSRFVRKIQPARSVEDGHDVGEVGRASRADTRADNRTQLALHRDVGQSFQIASCRDRPRPPNPYLSQIVWRRQKWSGIPGTRKSWGEISPSQFCVRKAAKS